MIAVARSGVTAVSLVFIAVFIGILALLLASGTPITTALLQSCMVTAQGATGAILWMLIRRSGGSVVEHLGMGFALGTLLALGSGVLLRDINATWGWALPALLVALVGPLILWRRRPDIVTSPVELLGLAVTIGVGLLLLASYVIRSPLPTDRITSSVHPDLPFFETLSIGLATFGPSDSLLMSQTQIRYHWLSYAWAGQLDLASDAPPFQVLSRLLPVVAFVAISALAVSWAWRMSRVPWVPSLAGLLVVLSGFVGARFGVLTNLDSPSQLFSLMWLLALSATLFSYLARQVGHISVVVLFLLAFSTAGGKVSAGTVAVVGTAVVAVVSVLRRESTRPRTIAASSAVTIGAICAYALLISGVDVAENIGVGGANDKAAVFQGLLPFNGYVGLLAGTAILVLAALPRLAGLIPLLADRHWRWRPEVVFAVATVVAGAGALFVLSEGVNDLWFIVSASGPACVVAAVGVGLAASKPLPLRKGGDARFVVALLSVLVVLTLVLLSRTADPYMGVRLWATSLAAVCSALLLTWVLIRLVPSARAQRSSVALALLVISLTTMGLLGRIFEFSDGSSSRGVYPLAELPNLDSVTPADVPSTTVTSPTVSSNDTTGSTVNVESRPADVWSAAIWAAENLSREAILATNRPESLEMTALGARRAYLAGIRYQIGLGAASSASAVPVRAAISHSLNQGPTRDSLAALCSAAVTHLWFEGRPDLEAWGPSTTRAYANDSVTILELNANACA